MTKDASMFSAFGSLIIIYGMYSWRKDFSSYEIDGSSLSSIENKEVELLNSVINIGKIYNVGAPTCNPNKNEISLNFNPDQKYSQKEAKFVWDRVESLNIIMHEILSSQIDDKKNLFHYVTISNETLRALISNNKKIKKIKESFINMESRILIYGTLIWGFGDRIMKIFI
jgi:hypothetical protein